MITGIIKDITSSGLIFGVYSTMNYHLIKFYDDQSIISSVISDPGTNIFVYLRIFSRCSAILASLKKPKFIKEFFMDMSIDRKLIQVEEVELECISYTKYLV